MPDVSRTYPHLSHLWNVDFSYQSSLAGEKSRIGRSGSIWPRQTQEMTLEASVKLIWFSWWLMKQNNESDLGRQSCLFRLSVSVLARQVNLIFNLVQIWITLTQIFVKNKPKTLFKCLQNIFERPRYQILLKKKISMFFWGIVLNNVMWRIWWL